jgi:hypothetical protein
VSATTSRIATTLLKAQQGVFITYVTCLVSSDQRYLE